MIYLIVTNNSNNELPVLHRSEYPGKTNHVEYDYDEYTWQIIKVVCKMVNNQITNNCKT